jgi:hypothetical protein
MPFELLPPLGDPETRALRAAVAASGFALDPASDVYGTAWRRAAIDEAAGYDVGTLHAAFGSETRRYQLVGPDESPREPVPRPYARSPRRTRGATRA